MVIQESNIAYKFIKFRSCLEAASESTNAPLSSACTWTPFHLPPDSPEKWLLKIGCADKICSKGLETCCKKALLLKASFWGLFRTNIWELNFLGNQNFPGLFSELISRLLIYCWFLEFLNF